MHVSVKKLLYSSKKYYYSFYEKNIHWFENQGVSIVCAQKLSWVLITCTSDLLSLFV